MILLSVHRNLRFRCAIWLYGAGRSIGASMDRLLRYFLSQFIRRGTMTFTTASGTTFTCGDGTGPPVSVRFLTTTDRAADPPQSRTGARRSLHGRHVRGRERLDRGRAGDPAGPARQWCRAGALQWWLRYLVRHAKQFNPRGRARNNVAHHYDLDGRLYSLFLDADKQYSCAYFETPDATLDDAQLAKKRHLAAKLLIGRGDRVLDIGSGWGGLGLYLAEMTGADVTGITLSTEQLQVVECPRGREEPGAHRRKFLLQDYRDIRRPLRPHRFGRHVRACRRRFLRDLFQALRRAAQRRRRHGAAFDRPLDRPGRDQPLDHQIHLPGRLHPRASPR